MAGRSFTRLERKARAKRILAAAERGETTAAIARSVGISPRQVRRVLATRAKPAAATELVVPDMLEIDPFGEVAKCVLVHREAINELRAVAATTTNGAIKVGAVKGAVAASAALIELLDRGSRRGSSAATGPRSHCRVSGRV